ncbi:putative retropepsin, aspartic peptidase domain superfamily, DNA/RNA polymerase superfamily [Helianthus anomalus]
METIISQKWLVKITLLIENSFKKDFIALIDSGADLNCLREGLIPTKYFEKTTQVLKAANKKDMGVKYKLPNVKICNNGECIPTSFVLVKNISNEAILGTPFLNKIFPLKEVDHKGFSATYKGKNLHFKFITQPIEKMINEILIQAKINQINFLKEEINIHTIEDNLKNPKLISKIELIKNQFNNEICNDHPNAFWNRKQHIVSLPYEKDFQESNVPTKARPCQMNSEYLELCKREIASLQQKGLINPSKSPWSCTAFYVNKHSEQERVDKISNSK